MMSTALFAVLSWGAFARLVSQHSSAYSALKSMDENNYQVICSDYNLQNVHAREFKLRLGFSSYDEQVTRNWHRQ